MSSTDYEDKDEEDDGSEREDVDEYEEELRGVAESHEAMSRDERSNSTGGLSHPEINVSHSETMGTRNFDSHEKTVEENSDESMTSNEAISNEAKSEREVIKIKHFNTLC